MVFNDLIPKRSGSAKSLNRHASWFAKPLTPHMFFHTIFKSRQTFPREIAPPKIYPAIEARSVMKCRNFRITTRKHLLLALNPLYDWIMNPININTSQGNNRMNQVGYKKRALDPSPESWARPPQQPTSASVEKLWKILKNTQIFEFLLKFKSDPCPPCRSRSSTNCRWIGRNQQKTSP